MARVARSEEERLIIAHNIKQRRKDNYPSSGKCAEAFGVPHSQWSPWESGRRTPDPERLEKIAAFFKCSPEDLRTPPENWREKKAQFIKERDKASKSKKNAPAFEAEMPAEAEADSGDDGTADYISIVTMLARVQSSYDRGEIIPEQFAAKMQSIREFVAYSYHGLMDGRQSVG